MTQFIQMPGKKLLVADDSLTIQKVIRLALSNEGYEIQAVSDGNDAIQQISLFRPNVVLIDVSLPGKSAFEVKRELNLQPDFEEVRFVLMSSAFEKVDSTQTEEVRFHGHLTKPFDPAHLRQILTDVLAQVAAKRMEKTSFLPQPGAENLSRPPPFPILENESQEWRNSVEPEMPTLPPIPRENVRDLWEPEIEPALPTPVPVALPDEQDIQQLTHSTIQISDLEDYQWSVNEPSIKPLPQLQDRGNASLDLSPPKNFSENPGDPPLSIEEGTDGVTVASMPSPDLKMDLFPGFSSPEQIETFIRKQVQETLQAMAQKLLPEMAEQIIKAEIHRLLSE